MSKKAQIVIWVIILVAVLALLGGYVYSVVSRIAVGNIHPEVSIEIQDQGTIKLELYPEYAPNTVANFIRLAEKGYYDGKVIYGKDEICLYAGRNTEGNVDSAKTSLIFDSVDESSEYDYEYSIEGEFILNGHNENTLKHEKGILTLIRNDYTQYMPSLSEESYNSGNTQLGIMMSDESSNLNGAYAAFGRVVEGMEILENIYNNQEIAVPEVTENETTEPETAEVEAIEESTETEEAEDEGGIQAFANYPVITSIKVDTKGINHGNPKVQEAFDYNAYMYNLMSQYYGSY